MAKAKTPEQKKAQAEKASATRAANKTERETQAPIEVLDALVNALDEQDDNPAPNNGIPAPKSVNKPMTEYSTTETVKRKATPEEEAAHVGEQENEPRRLEIGEGPGNLMVIKWNHGGGRVPRNCQGGWNNKQRAQDAITAAHRAKDFDETQTHELALAG